MTLLSLVALCCRLALSAGLSPFTSSQTAQPPLVDVPYTEDDESVWVPYYATQLKATSPTTLVASVFVTDSERRTPESLAAVLSTSGANPTVTYTIGGKPVTYTFSEESVLRSAL